MGTHKKPRNTIELMLPCYAKEVKEKINRGFVPEKATEEVFNSHQLLKKNTNFLLFFKKLKQAFPEIFPTTPSWQIKDAAKHLLSQGGGRAFIEDISSDEEYERALNALS